MAIRICAATIPFVMEVKDGVMTGVMGPVFDTLYKERNRFVSNFTYHSSNKLGDLDPVTQQYDGCLGQLQRNETDVQIPMIDFPILSPGLVHGYVLTASTTTMVSSYNATPTESGTDVMDAVRSFEPSLWFLIAGMTAVVTILIYVTIEETQDLRRAPSSLWAIRNQPKLESCPPQTIRTATNILIGNIVKQHSSYSYSGQMITVSLLILLFAVFSYFILFYFSSMIKTEMVVQKRPETISSYEELLQHEKVRPVWLGMLTDHWSFQQAPADSPKGRIWQRAQRIGMDKCFIQADPTAIEDIVRMGAKREMIWLVSRYYLEPLITNMCAMSSEGGLYPDANLWIKTDPGADEKLSGCMTPASTPVSHRRLLERYEQALFEHDIIGKAIQKMNFIVSRNSGSRRLRDCMAKFVSYSA